MILLGILLIQVFCLPLQSEAQGVNASNASNVAGPTSVTAQATPTLLGNTITIEVPNSVFSSKAVAPDKTTSTQAPATSAYIQSLLDEANSILQGLNTGNTNSGGGGVTASNNPQGECDGLDWNPTLQCNTTECSEGYTGKVSKLIKCLGSKPENVSSLDLADMIERAGKVAAERLIDQVNRGEIAAVNASSLTISETFAFGSGVIDGGLINNTKDEFMNFPDYSKPEEFRGRWETMRDRISVPVEMLKELGAATLSYTWSVFPDIIEDRPLKMTEIETDYNQIIRDSDVSDLYLDDHGVLRTKKKVQKIFINSNVFSLNIMRDFKNLKNPVLVTLRHKKDSLEKPSCVYWDKITSIWSRKGCQIHETNSTHTICACNHLTMFAVTMKEKIIEDLSDREAVVTTATVLGVISSILLVGSAICIFFVGYHFVDNMRIALNIEAALLLSHLFFFIGLSSSSSKYVATPATCDVISPFVHMFELAALAFLLMEGVFYVEKFTSIFNKKNTRTFYVYMAFGWGLPVAFATACAGYSYKHYGSPTGNEFCWMSVYGEDAWFFGAPVLILVLLNLIVRGVVLQNVLGWKGSPDDINIERTRYRLISSIVLLPVIILTWLFGILATNHSDEKVYHYFFIIFHFLQGLFVFIFYCARNTEMWDYYKNKKEKAHAEKTAVYQFQYVP